MSARGCPDATCAWNHDERVAYCLDCGRFGGCTCTVAWLAGSTRGSARPRIVQVQPDCPVHAPGEREATA